VRLWRPPQKDWLPEHAAGLKAGDDAVDALRRDAHSFRQEEPVKLLAAAAWILLAQLQDPLHNVRRRLRLADVAGPAAASFQAGGSVLPAALNPTANGVRAASKVTSRETCFAVVLLVPVHH
jgi:hypothetical protein